jgi:hypothetical protein
MELQNLCLFLIFIIYFAHSAHSTPSLPRERKESLNSNAPLSISSLSGKCFAERSIRYAIFFCLAASSQKESNPITFFYERGAFCAA